MIGIEILKPVKVNLSQDTQKLKKISQKESLKDYRKDVSIWVTGMQRCAANLQILVHPFVGFYFKSYPYFLNHFTNFEHKSKIAGALIICSSGGIGAAKGGIPSNFNLISTGFLPESLIRVIEIYSK